MVGLGPVAMPRSFGNSALIAQPTGVTRLLNGTSTTTTTLSIYRVPEYQPGVPPEKIVLILEADGQCYGLGIPIETWGQLILATGEEFPVEVIDGETNKIRQKTRPQKLSRGIRDPNLDDGPGAA